MANYTKREENRADVARMIEAGITPARAAMPRCECGELAKLHVHTRRGDWLFREHHAERAEARFQE